MATDSKQNDQDLCVNLRTRANYVPGLQQSRTEYNPSDYTPCFCLKTLHVIGPDDRPVGLAECNRQRPCFESLSQMVA